MSVPSIVKEYYWESSTVVTNDLPTTWVCSLSFEAENATLSVDYIGPDFDAEMKTFPTLLEIRGRNYNHHFREWFPKVPQQMLKTKNVEFKLEKDIMCLQLIFTVFYPDKKASNVDVITHANPSFAGYDVCDPTTIHDQVLLIGEKKFYVKKSVLSCYSTFFDGLFNGNFEDGKKEEIELKEVDADEFKTLLHVIHPTSIGITAENVAYLWKLADRFGVACVAKMCEEYLCSFEGKKLGNLTISDRMELAKKYNSAKLEAVLFAVMKKLGI